MLHQTGNTMLDDNSEWLHFRTSTFWKQYMCSIHRCDVMQTQQQNSLQFSAATSLEQSTSEIKLDWAMQLLLFIYIYIVLGKLHYNSKIYFWCEDSLLHQILPHPDDIHPLLLLHAHIYFNIYAHRAYVCNADTLNQELPAQMVGKR